LFGGDGDEMATGGAADAFLVFSCIVEPAWMDALWAATAAAVEAAALFSARLPRGMVKSRLCFASEAAPEVVAAFILESSFLDA